MKFTILGAGSAFSLKNYQPNLLLEQNDSRLLIDAGGDIRFSLRDVGLSSANIDAVYITHLHNDHIGGMEYIAFTTFFNPNKIPPKLFCHKLLLEDLWSNSLKGGLSSVQGKILNMYDYFDVNTLNIEGSFQWEGIDFAIVPAVHVFNGYSHIPTFGLIFKTEQNNTVYITSDTQYTPEKLMDAYQRADYIIQDCETTPFRSSVHAHFEELCQLPDDIKAKMMLWHYQDNVIDNLEDWQQKAHENGFNRFLLKGEIFTL